MGMHEGREEDGRLLAGGHERRDEWTVLAFVGSAYKLFMYYRAAHCNTIVTAIATQANATYGDRRSPRKTRVSEHRA